jgi:hypothetical protein|tara:strand:- start:718 stop:888 length:171 start_codon:yes stop_codon:yes gene_type:complete
MDIKKMHNKWRESCPEEANGLVTRKIKKRGWKLLNRRIQGAEARKKRDENKSFRQS